MRERMPIESSLVAGLRNGDEVAFKMVYESYCRRIYSFVYGFLKNKEQAEEIVQESLLNLWINREQLDERYPVGPYLYTISRRLTLNMLRHTANSQAVREKLWLILEETHNETEEAVLVADLERFTEEVLVKLPKQQQLVFRMSRNEGLSYDQIAERLNISRNTVKNHLVEALKNLRIHFNKSDVAYFIFFAYFFF